VKSKNKSTLQLAAIRLNSNNQKRIPIENPENQQSMKYMNAAAKRARVIHIDDGILMKIRTHNTGSGAPKTWRATWFGSVAVVPDTQAIVKRERQHES